jgi:hypothetical protein
MPENGAPTPEAMLLHCLEWLDNLEATVGTDVLLNHKPNNFMGRAAIYQRTGLVPAPRPADTTEYRMFTKEQRGLLPR